MVPVTCVFQLLLPNTICEYPRAIGAVATTEEHSAAIALASSSVNVCALPNPARTPPVLMLPACTIMTLLPMDAICSWMRLVAPLPTATIAITAPTPMITPSMVSALRSLFTRSARNAIFIACRTFFMRPAPSQRR